MAVCLLLTATINVGATAFSSRTDPESRLRDYEQALRFWIAKSPVDRIVFCENSGANLDVLRETACRADVGRSRTEFLGFKAQGLDPKRGKGAGEVSILSHALRESSLLKSDDHVLKVTGRYVVPNSDVLVAQANAAKPPDIICNLTQNLTYADSRVFLMRAELLQSYFLSRKEMIDDSRQVHFEHVLAHSVLRAISEGYRWDLPADRPDIRGISGTNGRRVGDMTALRLTKAAKFRVKRFFFGGLG